MGCSSLWLPCEAYADQMCADLCLKVGCCWLLIYSTIATRSALSKCRAGDSKRGKRRRPQFLKSTKINQSKTTQIWHKHQIILILDSIRVLPCVWKILESDFNYFQDFKSPPSFLKTSKQKTALCYSCKSKLKDLQRRSLALNCRFLSKTFSFISIYLNIMDANSEADRLSQKHPHNSPALKFYSRNLGGAVTFFFSLYHKTMELLQCFEAIAFWRFGSQSVCVCAESIWMVLNRGRG